MDMIKTVAEEVGKLSPEHSVDIKNADRTILIELYRVSATSRPHCSPGFAVALAATVQPCLLWRPR